MSAIRSYLPWPDDAPGLPSPGQAGQADGQVWKRQMVTSDPTRRLNIHPESVRRLIRQGNLPAYKPANKWLMERDVLEQFTETYDGRPGAKPRLL